MVEVNTRYAAWAALHRPETSAEELARIAAHHPEFADAISAHPNAYEELRIWLTQVSPAPAAAAQPSALPLVGTSGATAAVEPPRRLDWAWIMVYGLLLLSEVVWWIVMHANQRQWEMGSDSLEDLTIGVYLVSPLVLAIAVGAASIGSAPSRGRKAWVIVLALVIPILLFAASALPYFVDALYGMTLFDIVTYISPLLMYPLLGTAYAIARPIRGLGWLGFPFFAVFPAAADWYLIHGASWIAVPLALITIGVALAEWLTRVSERRDAEFTRQAAINAGGAAVDPSRTNTLAILSLIFAFLISILAVIFGHIALSQIKRSGEAGRGMAIAGLVLGYVSLVIGTVIAVFYIANAAYFLSLYGGY